MRHMDITMHAEFRLVPQYHAERAIRMDQPSGRMCIDNQVPFPKNSENSKKITQIPDVIASIDKTVYNQLAVKILTSKLDLN